MEDRGADRAHPEEPDSESVLAELRALALRSSERAHAPYSRLRVGAAVRMELPDGGVRLYGGTNVENASYGLTQCAERVAVGAAITDGARRLQAVFIVAGDSSPISPCGACRQVLAEFGDEGTVVVSRSLSGEEQRWTLGELLPDSMGANDLPDQPAPRSAQGGANAGGEAG